MTSSLEILSMAVLAAVFIAYLRLLKVTAVPPGIPRLGIPGLTGYLYTALRYTLDAEPVMKSGREQFSGHPYAVPTLAGSVIVLGPEYLELLRASNDTVASGTSSTMSLTTISNPLRSVQPTHGDKRGRPSSDIESSIFLMSVPRISS